jgi:hypothetical protein
LVVCVETGSQERQREESRQSMEADLEELTRSREEALESGSKYYVKQCAKHGLARRLTSNGKCVECRREYRERRREALGIRPKVPTVPKVVVGDFITPLAKPEWLFVDCILGGTLQLSCIVATGREYLNLVERVRTISTEATEMDQVSPAVSTWPRPMNEWTIQPNERTMTTETNTYPPDHHMRLHKREYSLFSRDLDTIHQLRRLHGFRTAAESISYLLRTYGEPELQQSSVSSEDGSASGELSLGASFVNRIRRSWWTMSTLDVIERVAHMKQRGVDPSAYATPLGLEEVAQGLEYLATLPAARDNLLAYFRESLKDFPERLKPDELYRDFEAVLDIVAGMELPDWQRKYRGEGEVANSDAA